MTYKPQPFTGEGSPLRQIGYFLIFALVVAAVRPVANFRTLFSAVPLSMIFALVWCWLSLSWSIAPDIGFRRLALTTILIWTVFLSVSLTGYVNSVRIMRVITVITLIANFIAVLAFPQFGIHQVDELADPGLIGAWRGIMLQKNFAGAICVFTIIAFLFESRNIHVLLRLAVVIPASFFLYMSQSKTSMGVCVFALVIGWIYLRYNPVYRALMIPLLVILGSIAFWFIQLHWDSIIAPLNTPGAFTGRTQIWPALIKYASDHPLLGSGYGSFWNIGLGDGPIFTYAKGWVTQMAQGHNGYLDMLVAIGIPGLVLVIFAVLIMPVFRLLADKAMVPQRGALLISIVIFAIGHNFTESSLFERDTIVQTFLMLAIALIGPATQGVKELKSANLHDQKRAEDIKTSILTS